MRKTVLFAVISVLAVSVFSVTISAQSQYDIPAWVKGVAGFWAEDKITDSEFGEGLSFLIDSEIIKIPLIQELQNEINQLKAENSELRSQLNLPEPSTPEPPLHGDPEPSTPEPPLHGDPEPLPPTISISTNKVSYGNGGVVVISGNIQNYDPSLVPPPAVTYLVMTPDGQYRVGIGQILPNYDGSFSISFIAGGNLWKLNGDYIIQAGYGIDTSEITINYVGGDLPESTLEPTRIIAIAIDQDISIDGKFEISGNLNNPESLWIFVSMDGPSGENLRVNVLSNSRGQFIFPIIDADSLFRSEGDYTINLFTEYQRQEDGYIISIHFENGIAKVF